MRGLLVRERKAYTPAMIDEKTKRDQNPDEVLRKMLSTPPKPHGKAEPKKKPKKRAK